MEDKKVRVALYARFAKDEQENYEILYMENFCRQNNFDVVKIYQDKTVVSTCGRIYRPEFHLMIRESSLKLFDMVLVKEPIVFHSDRYKWYMYKVILEERGVSICVINEPDNPPHILKLNSVLEGCAKYKIEILIRQRNYRSIRRENSL